MAGQSGGGPRERDSQDHSVGQEKEGAFPGMDLGLLYTWTRDAGLPGWGAMLGLTLGSFRGDFPLLGSHPSPLPPEIPRGCPRGPRLPFPTPLDCPSAPLASSTSQTPSSLPPDGVHCLARPGARCRSAGLCPGAHPAGLPPAPGCSPGSRPWDSRGPQQPVLPFPRRHPPPLQTAVENRLRLEALPALHMPTTHRRLALGDWALREGRGTVTSLAQSRLLGSVS